MRKILFLLATLAFYCSANSKGLNASLNLALQPPIPDITPQYDGHDGAHLQAALNACTKSTFTIGGGLWDVSDYVPQSTGNPAYNPITVPTTYIRTIQGMPDGSTVIGLGADTLNTSSILKIGGMDPVDWIQNRTHVPAASMGFTQTGTFYPSGRSLPQAGDTAVTLPGNAMPNFPAGTFVLIADDDMVSNFEPSTASYPTRSCQELHKIAGAAYNFASMTTTLTLVDPFMKTFPQRGTTALLGGQGMRNTCWIRPSTYLIPENVTVQNLTIQGEPNSSQLFVLSGVYNCVVNSVNVQNYGNGAIEMEMDRHITFNNCTINSGASASNISAGYGFELDGVQSIVLNQCSNLNPTLKSESACILHASSDVTQNYCYGLFYDLHGEDSNHVRANNCDYMGISVANGSWYYGDYDVVCTNCNLNVSNQALYEFGIRVAGPSHDVTSTNSDWGFVDLDGNAHHGFIHFPSGVAGGGKRFSVTVTVSGSSVANGSGTAGPFTLGTSSTTGNTYNDVLTGVQAIFDGIYGASSNYSQGLFCGAGGSNGSNSAMYYNGTSQPAYDVNFVFSELLWAEFQAGHISVVVNDLDGAGFAYYNDLRYGAVYNVSISGNRIISNFIASNTFTTTTSWTKAAGPGSLNSNAHGRVISNKSSNTQNLLIYTVPATTSAPNVPVSPSTPGVISLAPGGNLYGQGLGTSYDVYVASTSGNVCGNISDVLVPCPLGIVSTTSGARAAGGGGLGSKVPITTTPTRRIVGSISKNMNVFSNIYIGGVSSSQRMRIANLWCQPNYGSVSATGGGGFPFTGDLTLAHIDAEALFMTKTSTLFNFESGFAGNASIYYNDVREHRQDTANINYIAVNATQFAGPGVLSTLTNYIDNCAIWWAGVTKSATFSDPSSGTFIKTSLGSPGNEFRTTYFNAGPADWTYITP